MKCYDDLRIIQKTKNVKYARLPDLQHVSLHGLSCTCTHIFRKRVTVQLLSSVCLCTVLLKHPQDACVIHLICDKSTMCFVFQMRKDSRTVASFKRHLSAFPSSRESAGSRERERRVAETATLPLQTSALFLSTSEPHEAIGRNRLPNRTMS